MAAIKTMSSDDAFIWMSLFLDIFICLSHSFGVTRQCDGVAAGGDPVAAALRPPLSRHRLSAAHRVSLDNLLSNKNSSTNITSVRVACTYKLQR